MKNKDKDSAGISVWLGVAIMSFLLVLPELCIFGLMFMLAK